MIIRKLRENDAGLFLELLKRLDHETKFMLYEPGERESTVEDIRLKIIKSEKSSSLLLAAEDNDRLAGYLSAERGFAKRIKHSCYIVIGILKDYTHQGIGTKLFQEMEAWARANDITRLELTVMTHNEPAIKLYRKIGFKVEGVKEKSIKIDDRYIDEYYMAKILYVGEKL